VEAEDDPKPIEMDAAPEALEQLAAAEHEAVRERAGKLRNLLKAPDAAAPDDGDDEPMPLTEAQQTRYAQGKALYQAVCMACHQAHGKGQPGMAPSLRGTPWVEGPEEQLVRIVLDGLEGPIVVDGEKWNLVMPGHRESPILSDERIAAILTYVRRTWGNEASPVEPDTVQRIREATADRRRPWTAEELEALEPKNQDGE